MLDIQKNEYISSAKECRDLQDYWIFAKGEYESNKFLYHKLANQANLNVEEQNLLTALLELKNLADTLQQRINISNYNTTDSNIKAQLLHYSNVSHDYYKMCANRSQKEWESKNRQEKIKSRIFGTFYCSSPLLISVGASLGVYASHSALDTFDATALGHSLACGIPLVIVSSVVLLLPVHLLFTACGGKGLGEFFR